MILHSILSKELSVSRKLLVIHTRNCESEHLWKIDCFYCFADLLPSISSWQRTKNNSFNNVQWVFLKSEWFSLKFPSILDHGRRRGGNNYSNWDYNNQPSNYNDSYPITQSCDFRQIPETVFSVSCGEIRPKDDGVRVKISGKVFKRPNSYRFLEIKDVRGCTQLVANDDRPDIQQKFQSILSDAYITVIGTVQLRPSRFINHVSVTEGFNSKNTLKNLKNKKLKFQKNTLKISKKNVKIRLFF